MLWGNTNLVIVKFLIKKKQFGRKAIEFVTLYYKNCSGYIALQIGKSDTALLLLFQPFLESEGSTLAISAYTTFSNAIFTVNLIIFLYWNSYSCLSNALFKLSICLMCFWEENVILLVTISLRCQNFFTGFIKNTSLL